MVRAKNKVGKGASQVVAWEGPFFCIFTYNKEERLSGECADHN